MVYNNLWCTLVFSPFHLLLWWILYHCYYSDNNHIRSSSFIHLQIDLTHEASEKASPGHGQCFLHLHCEHLHCFPRSGWLPQWPSYLFVLCHTPKSTQNDTKAQKRQPALLLTEISTLIHYSTWAEDLNFIMCSINCRVLEITYNITGSEWISISRQSSERDILNPGKFCFKSSTHF